LESFLLETMKAGVIASPLRESASPSRDQQMAQDVAIGVEDADIRDGSNIELLLPTRLPQQRIRGENRGCPIVLVA
jgi:hypothetical protein